MWSPQIPSAPIALGIKLNSGSLNKPLCLRVNERPEQRCTRFPLRNFWSGGVLIIRKYCQVGASLDCSSSSLCYSTEPQSPLLVFWAEDQHLKWCYGLGLRLARYTAALTFRHTPVWLQGREGDSLSAEEEGSTLGSPHHTWLSFCNAQRRSQQCLELNTGRWLHFVFKKANWTSQDLADG